MLNKSCRRWRLRSDGCVWVKYRSPSLCITKSVDCVQQLDTSSRHQQWGSRYHDWSEFPERGGAGNHLGCVKTRCCAEESGGAACSVSLWSWEIRCSNTPNAKSSNITICAYTHSETYRRLWGIRASSSTWLVIGFTRSSSVVIKIASMALTSSWPPWDTPTNHWLYVSVTHHFWSTVNKLDALKCKNVSCTAGCVVYRRLWLLSHKILLGSIHIICLNLNHQVKLDHCAVSEMPTLRISLQTYTVGNGRRRCFSTKQCHS